MTTMPHPAPKPLPAPQKLVLIPAYGLSVQREPPQAEDTHVERLSADAAYRELLVKLGAPSALADRLTALRQGRQPEPTPETAVEEDEAVAMDPAAQIRPQEAFRPRPVPSYEPDESGSHRR